MTTDIKFIVSICSSAIGLSLGLFGIGYSIGSHRKMKAVSDIIHKSVDDIVANDKFDIPKELIDEAVKEQVSKKVEVTVQRKVDDMCDDISRKIRVYAYDLVKESAEKAVNETYNEMKPEAKESIQKALKNIDISSLKREVKDEAKKAVSEKLESSMDDILEQFNSNLSNVKNIYSSIAKSMNPAA